MNEPEELNAGRKDGRRLVSILQACVVAGVSRRTIYNWLDKGLIESTRTAGGSVRIFADSLFVRHLEDPRL